MAGFIERVMSRLGYAKVNNTLSSYNPRVQLETNPKNYFELLWAYYLNNSLYDEATRILRQIVSAGEPVKPLRNPANRTVEFYAMTIWPGDLPDALPIIADNDRIIEPIDLIWKWSNWSQRKQASIRQFAATGNMFIKVAQTETDSRPYLKPIPAQQVSALKIDERDFVEQIRIDTAIDKDALRRTRTEFWDMDGVRVWEHNRGDADITQLGEPIADESATMDDMGIDFIPIAFGKFRDVGELYGQGAFVHALDKLDEVNRMASRVATAGFKNSKVMWALLSDSKDENNRPLAPVSVKSSDGKTNFNIADAERDTMLTLPGGNSLESLIPNLPYDKLSLLIDKQMGEIRSDLPELLYWDMSDEVSKDASGASIETRLEPALARALEARGSAERVLVRAQQMALTMGSVAGVFKGIGSFDAGDFEHSFKTRDVLRQKPVTKAAVERAIWDAVKAAQNTGAPIELILQRQGFSDVEVQQFINSAEYKARQKLTEAAINPVRQPA